MVSLTEPIKIVNPTSSIDYYYGPYYSISEAKSKLSGLLTEDTVGRIIGIKDTVDGHVTEYIYLKINGVCDFVQATPYIDSLTKHWIVNGIDTGVSAEGTSGNSGLSSITSYMFKRSANLPTQTECLTTEGSFLNPSPSNSLGWYDGIPTGNESLYQQKRLFTSDGKAPQDATWSNPILVADSDFIDVCYYGYNNGILPSAPTSHGDQGTDLNTWHNTGTEDDYWMAISHKSNGVWGPWSIVKIKGENGEQGNPGKEYIVSYVFKRNISLPETPTGGSFSNLVPTGWNDGIPSGSDPIWMSHRKFCNNSTYDESNWSTPIMMSDTSDFDIAYHTAFSNDHIPITSEYPTTHLTEDQGNGWTNVGSTNTVWMAIDRKVNGVWQGWSVMKIKGELGNEGNGIYFATIYTSSSTTPSIPTEGEYNFSSNTLTPPTGWLISLSGLNSPVWESHKHFYSNGTTENWSVPTRIISNSQELLNDTVIYTKSVTLYKESSVAPTAPSFSSEDCGMDEDNWSNGNCEFVLPEESSWLLNIPDNPTNTIWYSTCSFHSDGKSTGWTGPYKYINISGILSAASTAGTNAANTAILNASSNLSTAINTANGLIELANTLQGQLSSAEETLGEYDLDAWSELSSSIEGFTSQYGSLSDIEGAISSASLSSTGFDQEVYDAIYEYLTIEGTNKYKELNSSLYWESPELEAGVKYSYTLNAKLKLEEDSQETPEVYTYTIAYSINGTDFTTLKSLDSTTSDNYSGVITNPTGETAYKKIRIERTDSGTSIAKIYFRKVITSAISSLVQKANSLSTTVGLILDDYVTLSEISQLKNSISSTVVSLLTNGEGTLDSKFSQIKQEIENGIALTASDVQFALATDSITVLKGQTVITPELSIKNVDYYPNVDFTVTAKNNDLSSTADFTIRVTNGTDIYDIYKLNGSPFTLKKNDVSKSELKIDSPISSTLTILNLSEIYDVVIVFRYNIAAAVGQVLVSDESIISSVSSALGTDGALKTAVLSITTDQIKSTLSWDTNSDGTTDVYSAIILGINTTQSGENSSYINLVADLITAAGTLIADEIEATGLNIDNKTKIFGNTNITLSGELMALGLGTTGESHFYADGTGSLANGLIQWAGLLYNSNGEIIYDTTGVPLKNGDYYTYNSTTNEYTKVNSETTGATLVSGKPLSLYIKGIINAAAGLIGGWTLAKSGTDNYLYAKHSDGKIVLISPEGGIKCYSVNADTQTQVTYWDLNADGSGSLANGNVTWNASGNVTFSNNVTMAWGNISGTSNVALKSDIGDKYYIGSDNYWYVYNTSNNPYPGTKTTVKAEGNDGTSVNIKDSLSSTSELANIQTPNNGDGYIIGEDLWVYTGGNLEGMVSGFKNVGVIRGPLGASATQYYIHYVYCKNPATGENYSTTEANDYMGVYVDTDSDDASTFAIANTKSGIVWAKIKGEPGTSITGPSGASVSTRSLYYVKTASAAITTAPNKPNGSNLNGWSTIIDFTAILNVISNNNNASNSKLYYKVFVCQQTTTTTSSETIYSYTDPVEDTYSEKLGSYSTYIGSDGIYSGQITTDLLVAGSAMIGSGLIDKLYIDKIYAAVGDQNLLFEITNDGNTLKINKNLNIEWADLSETAKNNIKVPNADKYVYSYALHASADKATVLADNNVIWADTPLAPTLLKPNLWLKITKYEGIVGGYKNPVSDIYIMYSASLYVVDLSREISNIGIGSDKILDVPTVLTETTTVNVYKNGTLIPCTINEVKCYRYNNSNELEEFTMSSENKLTYSTSQTLGDYYNLLTVTLYDGLSFNIPNLSYYFDISITADTHSFTKRFTVFGNEKGVDGITYRIISNPASIVFNPNTSSYNQSTITLSVYKYTGGVGSRIIDLQNAGLTLLQYINSAYSSLSSNSISTSGISSDIQIRLVSGSDVLDEITIPYLTTGVNGLNGADAYKAELTNESTQIFTTNNSVVTNLTRTTSINLYLGTLHKDFKITNVSTPTGVNVLGYTRNEVCTGEKLLAITVTTSADFTSNNQIQFTLEDTNTPANTFVLSYSLQACENTHFYELNPEHSTISYDPNYFTTDPNGNTFSTGSSKSPDSITVNIIKYIGASSYVNSILPDNYSIWYKIDNGDYLAYDSSISTLNVTSLIHLCLCNKSKSDIENAATGTIDYTYLSQYVIDLETIPVIQSGKSVVEWYSANGASGSWHLSYTSNDYYATRWTGSAWSDAYRIKYEDITEQTNVNLLKNSAFSLDIDPAFTTTITKNCTDSKIILLTKSSSATKYVIAKPSVDSQFEQKFISINFDFIDGFDKNSLIGHLCTLSGTIYCDSSNLLINLPGLTEDLSGIEHESQGLYEYSLLYTFTYLNNMCISISHEDYDEIPDNYTIYIFHPQLELGTTASTWQGPKSYLELIFEDGDTDILGGAILSNILAVRNDSDITGGISGLNNVLLWGGGTYDLAIYASANNYALSASNSSKIQTLIRDNGTGKIGPFEITTSGASLKGNLDISNTLYINGSGSANLRAGINGNNDNDVVFWAGTTLNAANRENTSAPFVIKRNGTGKIGPLKVNNSGLIAISTSEGSITIDSTEGISMLDSTGNTKMKISTLNLPTLTSIGNTLLNTLFDGSEILIDCSDDFIAGETTQTFTIEETKYILLNSTAPISIDYTAPSTPDLRNASSDSTISGNSYSIILKDPLNNIKWTNTLGSISNFSLSTSGIYTIVYTHNITTESITSNTEIKLETGPELTISTTSYPNKTLIGLDGLYSFFGNSYFYFKENSGFEVKFLDTVFKVNSNGVYVNNNKIS